MAGLLALFLQTLMSVSWVLVAVVPMECAWTPLVVTRVSVIQAIQGMAPNVSVSVPFGSDDRVCHKFNALL